MSLEEFITTSSSTTTTIAITAAKVSGIFNRKSTLLHYKLHNLLPREADLRDKRILRLYRRWSTRAAKTYTSGPRDRLGEERDERKKIPLAQRGIEKRYRI
ncbi:hypothetical protein PV325_002752 [Microctonus aethiopoides]|nr:hypothetical protein PV325_002752 [Microctonus aethiopoides]KAK0095794.1 hypothetical protein PV326_007356 [Microctonus aethiopoides]